MTHTDARRYRVTALLFGFDHVTRDDLVIAAAAETRFDPFMRLSSICECVRTATTLREYWKQADRVLHVRIDGPDPHHPPKDGLYSHAAVVLDVLKPSSRGSREPGSMTCCGNCAPYDGDAVIG